MPNPTRVEINCTTGEVLEIELTDAEVAEMADQEAVAAVRAEAKAALLDRLGITAEEAALLLA